MPVYAGPPPATTTAAMPCRLAPICMGVLYHISTDDKHKSLFSYTRAVSLVYERLVAIGDLRREPELIALAVNLSQNARNAAALCEGPRFDKLMQHALDGKSDLLFKVMRNCSQVRRRHYPAPPHGRLSCADEGAAAGGRPRAEAALLAVCRALRHAAARPGRHARPLRGGPRHARQPQRAGVRL